ncbi:MAG: hypothetical protein ACREX3_17600 [Gammaproteobacteria bacterium]
MATIFDGPIPAVDLKDPSGIGLFLWSAGDAVGDFTGVVLGLLLDRFPIDGEGLPEVRQVEVAVERGGGPDLPDLDSPCSKTWFLRILEMDDDLLEEVGLVAVDGQRYSIDALGLG